MGPHFEDASAEQIREFSESVLSPETQIAFPTFVTKCRSGEFDLLDELKIPLYKVLHGEQEYTYHGDILPRSQLQYETRIANVMEKRSASSSLMFLIFESDIINADSGDLVVSSKTTFIIRSKLK